MAALHGHGHSMSESGIGRDYITGLYSQPPQRPPPSPPTSSYGHSRGTSLPPLVIPNNGSPTPRPLSVRPHEAPTAAGAFLNFSLPRPVACRKTSSIDSRSSKSTHLTIPSMSSTHTENQFLSPDACLVPPPPPKSPRRPSMCGSDQIPLPLPAPTRPLSCASDPSQPRPLSSGSESQVPELEPDIHHEDDVSSISDCDETPPPPNYAPPSPPSPCPPPSPPPRSPLRPLSMDSGSPQLPPPSPKSQLHRSHFYPGKRNPPARINFRLSQGYYHHKSSKSTPNLRRQSDDSTASDDTNSTAQRRPKTYNLTALNSLISPSDLDFDPTDPTVRQCGKAEADAFEELIGIIDRYNAKEGGPPPPVPGRLPRRVSSLNVRVATPVIDPVEEQRELGERGLRRVDPGEYVAEVEGVWGSCFGEDSTPV
ncbi:hypothetical protein B0T20DRAFT_455615 [Sordaria brevicollis]|uniref:Uncharacterized protein n=1 Tax=Sordaria brevicollis TaxID=83679 RepID=A0AAE0P9R7_SORBR|nr:hypothetical protein B0T20DRAFT_455615 [Sordaria brevicollis]